MQGGVQEIAIDDPEVIRVTQVALVKLNEKKEGNGEPKNLVEVVKASRQIVSGTLWRLTLKISQSNVHKTCDVEIWEQPWLDKTEVTVGECKDV